MLDAVAARNELFITTSPAKSTLSSSTKNARIAARVRRTDHEEAHADAAQIERVIAVERDVALRPAASFRSSAVIGDRPEKV